MPTSDKPGGNPRAILPRAILPRAILFDWDNTLIDSWPTILDALNTTFEAFDMAPWTMIEARERVRHSMRDSFPKLFHDRWEEAGEVFYQRYADSHVKKLRPLAGAEKMLEFLTDAGIYLGVVSNKKGDFLRHEAKHLGWDRFFGALVGALDAKKDKPSSIWRWPTPASKEVRTSGSPATPTSTLNAPTTRNACRSLSGNRRPAPENCNPTRRHGTSGTAMRFASLLLTCKIIFTFWDPRRGLPEGGRGA